MTKKKFIITSVIIVVCFAIWFVASFNPIPVYTYESSDRGMADCEVEWKGRPFSYVEQAFKRYKEQQGDPDIILCRTCERDWSSPSLWMDNLTDSRWDLPYMEPSANPKYFNDREKKQVEHNAPAANANKLTPADFKPEWKVGDWWIVEKHVLQRTQFIVGAMKLPADFPKWAEIPSTKNKYDVIDIVEIDNVKYYVVREMDLVKWPNPDDNTIKIRFLYFRRDNLKLTRIKTVAVLPDKLDEIVKVVYDNKEGFGYSNWGALTFFLGASNVYELEKFNEKAESEYIGGSTLYEVNIKLSLSEDKSIARGEFGDKNGVKITFVLKKGCPFPVYEDEQYSGDDIVSIRHKLVDYIGKAPGEPVWDENKDHVNNPGKSGENKNK